MVKNKLKHKIVSKVTMVKQKKKNSPVQGLAGTPIRSSSLEVPHIWG
jgi:hypothetical protein